MCDQKWNEPVDEPFDELAEADAAFPEGFSGATEACLDFAKYLFTKLSLSSRNLRYLKIQK